MLIKKLQKKRACPAKLQQSGGFVILFAVTLSAIILSIALGVSNIALKEIKFGTSAQDTNNAFFAADTGAECALLNDKSTGSAFVSNPLPITCNNRSIPVIENPTSVWNFTISGLSSGGQGCAKVTVDKTTSLITVVSKGYNVGDASCNSTSTGRVERELQVSYSGNSGGGTTCTSWTYSDWGACQPDNTQTRTVLTSSPTGCTGGNPVTTQSCTYVVPPSFSATGGTITYTDSNGLNPRSSPAYAGGYTIHTFTSTGPFTVTGSGNIAVLVVGGGGGSGGNGGGGGGAGGVIYNSSFAVTGQTYTVTVGGGGAGGSGTVAGTSGQNSIFSTLTAIGGGGGGSRDADFNGKTGGSGGGGGGSASGGSRGSGTSGQGKKGGNGYGSGGGYAAGGGGGCGGAGIAAGYSVGGNGGIGCSYNISGSSVYYGGGGGGGLVWGFSGTPGTGGLGGGGNGVTPGATGINGTANTGGGAGGGPASGGSGIVIIKYLIP